MSNGQASIHDTILEQVAELLKNADVSEEKKQEILASIVCPCCGGAGPSMVFDLDAPAKEPVRYKGDDKFEL